MVSVVMAEPVVNLSPEYVKVRVTSSLSSYGSENKFLTSITLEELKVSSLTTHHKSQSRPFTSCLSGKGSGL